MSRFYRFGNDILNMMPKAETTKGNTDKLAFSKTKHSCIKGHHQQNEKLIHRRKYL